MASRRVIIHAKPTGKQSPGSVSQSDFLLTPKGRKQTTTSGSLPKRPTRESSWNSLNDNDKDECSESPSSWMQAPSDSLSNCAEQFISQQDINPAPDTKSSHRTRKHHKKSKSGCFSCKGRRIKCPGNLPSCEKCVRGGLECKYPMMKFAAVKRPLLPKASLETANPLAVPQLQSTPTIFSMVDMRLFHHFIFNAYPHLPIGNDSVWTGQVLAVSHHYEFLMHAMLGLAASSIASCSSTGMAEYNTVALKHRLLAIKGINEALSQDLTKGGAGDALLAASFSLTFQCTYLKDGFREFFTMIRGCAIITGHLNNKSTHSFAGVSPANNSTYVNSFRFDNLPIIDSDLVDGASASLDELEMICLNPVNDSWIKSLRAIVDGLRVSSKLGYLNFMETIRSIAHLDNESFQDFLSPENGLTQIIHAHILAMQFILTPIFFHVRRSKSSSPVKSQVNWIVAIFENTEPEMQRYLNWPLEIAQRVRDEVNEGTGKRSYSIFDGIQRITTIS